jgi:hypothetical protein
MAGSGRKLVMLIESMGLVTNHDSSWKSTLRLEMDPKWVIILTVYVCLYSMKRLRNE